MEPSRTVSIDLSTAQLEAALTEAASAALSDFLKPPQYREEGGPGWNAVEQRVTSEAKSILAGRDLRAMVQEAIDRVAPEVIEAEVRSALAKAVQRALRDKPGIVLEKLQGLLGNAEVADGR
jgi:hypothetical protein